jgi:hypothetical protein
MKKFGVGPGGLAVPLPPVARRILIQVYEDGRTTCETSAFHLEQHVGPIDALSAASILMQIASQNLIALIQSNVIASKGQNVEETENKN